MDLQTYALLKNEIKKLSGSEINKAVSDYLEKNPSALQDSLGLRVIDNQLCMMDESAKTKAVSESDTEERED